VPDPTKGSSPSYSVEINGTLYFAANNGTNGKDPWKSDGTALGTVMVGDLNLYGDSSPSYLTVIDNKLFFAATDWY